MTLGKSKRTKALAYFHRGRQSIEDIAEALGEEPPTIREWVHGKPRQPLKRTATKPRRRAISPASRLQREKVRFAPSIVSGEEGCDPAHITPRPLGGCDDPLCTVPLTREEHRRFDHDRDLDLLPFLTQRFPDELAHALGHYNGDLIALLERVTCERWMPVDDPRRERFMAGGVG